MKLTGRLNEFLVYKCLKIDMILKIFVMGAKILSGKFIFKS